MARLPESAGSSPSRSLFFNSFGSPSAKDVAQNPEVIHEALLDAALREHNRVRDSAIRTFNNNQMRETQLKLLQEEKQERERLRLEQALADDRARVIALRKKKIPIPELPPREKTPPPPVTPVPPVQKQPIPAALPPQAQPQPRLQQPQLQPRPGQQIAGQAVTQAAPAQPLKPIQPIPTTAPQQLPPQPPIGAPTATPVTVSISSGYTSQPNILPGAKKYEEIHQNLKRLRHFIVDAGKNDPALRKKTGEMRREIRKSVGQLTSGKGATLMPKRKIHAVLLEALTTFQSPPVDPNMVLVTPRQPVEDAVNNGELPSLFIYLLNILSKAVVAQFIDEAGVSPKAADPIGVVAVSLFANKDFVWRNESLIDILMCKMRVACPVLFGLRGNEKTEEGRARLGWKKMDGHWVDPQVHNTRMTGLGAGYAAIALRDFSKAKMINPWPPTNYWLTLSSIVDTPPEEASDTQYIVLKALIENSESRFLTFYGDIGRSALSVALVVFPARALEQSVAVKAVAVLGDKLRRDVGLQLNPPTPQIGAFNTGRPIWG